MTSLIVCDSQLLVYVLKCVVDSQLLVYLLKCVVDCFCNCRCGFFVADVVAAGVIQMKTFNFLCFSPEFIDAKKSHISAWHPLCSRPPRCIN